MSWRVRGKVLAAYQIHGAETGAGTDVDSQLATISSWHLLHTYI